MKIGILLFALGVGLLSAGRSVADDPLIMLLDHSKITVVDGDTIIVGDKVFNLLGIDAPELGQQCYTDHKAWPCGYQAALALHKGISLAALPLRCEVIPHKNATSEVSCAEASSDLSLALLKEGLAAASGDASFGYRLAEKDARAAHLGIWRDTFVMPADWRAAMLAGAKRSLDQCPFQGQLRGEDRIVIVPPIDQPPKPVSGDVRIFCSDDEAIAAGWELRVGATPS